MANDPYGISPPDQWAGRKIDDDPYGIESSAPAMPDLSARQPAMQPQRGLIGSPGEIWDYVKSGEAVQDLTHSLPARLMGGSHNAVRDTLAGTADSAYRAFGGEGSPVQDANMSLPRLDESGFAGAVGRGIGTVGASALPGLGALKGVQLASSSVRLPAYLQAAGRLVSSMGTGSTTAKTLAGRVAQRIGGAAAGGAIAGVATNPEDAPMAAVIGAATGQIAPGLANMAVPAEKVVAAKIAQLNNLRAGRIPALARAQIAQAVGPNPSRVMANFADDAARSSSPLNVPQVAQSPGLSRMDKFLRNSTAQMDDGTRYADKAVGMDDTAQGLISAKLERQSSGLDRLKRLREEATRADENFLVRQRVPLETKKVFNMRDALIDRHGGNPEVKDAVQKVLQDVPSGVEVPFNRIFNSRVYKNRLIEAEYSVIGTLSKMSGTTKASLGKLSNSMTGVMKNAEGKAGVVFERWDRTWKEMSVPVNQKKIMRDIFESSMNTIKTVGGGDRPMINAAQFSRNVMKIKRGKPKVWAQLTDDQQVFLNGMRRDMQKIARSNRFAATQGSDTAKNLQDSVISPEMVEMARAQSGGGLIRDVLVGAGKAVGINTPAKQSHLITNELARLMSDKPTFARTLSEMAKAGQFKQPVPAPTNQFDNPLARAMAAAGIGLRVQP